METSSLTNASGQCANEMYLAHYSTATPQSARNSFKACTNCFGQSCCRA